MVCVSRPLGVDIVWYVYLDLGGGHLVVCVSRPREWTSCGMCI